MTWRFRVIFVFAATLAGCAKAQPPPATGPVAGGEKNWTQAYANVRDEWFEYLSDPRRGGEVYRWVYGSGPPPAGYLVLLERYAWAVSGVWWQREEFRFVVVDEDGNPVDDATRSVYEFVKLGNDLEPRFRVVTQKVVGEQRIAIRRDSGGLEIQFKSDTHRWTTVNLPGGGGRRVEKDWERFEMLKPFHEVISDGTVLPPLTPDGPVRVVMPFRYQWLDARENSTGSVILNRKWGGGKIPADAVPLVSSDAPGAVAVPKRGFYAVIDPQRQFMGVIAMDAGMLVGIEPTDDFNRREGKFWTSFWGGNGGPDGRRNSAYGWVLLHEPTRIPLEEMRKRHEKRMAEVAREAAEKAAQRGRGAGEEKSGEKGAPLISPGNE